MRIAKSVLTGVAVFCLMAAMSQAGEAGKERKGQVTVEINLKAPVDAKDVRLWIPSPVSDSNQIISDVTISGNYTKESVNRETRHGNTALYAEWQGPRMDRTLTYSFTVTRKELITKAFPDKEQLLSPAEFSNELDLSHLGSSEKKVRELAADITKGKTTVLGKARAVYDWIVDNMHRDSNVKGCGLAEIDRLLVEKGGKCADIHAVYVALARAAGVPARDVFGIRLPKGKEGDMTKSQHCWAEFYLPGYGWVVVDPADVLKYKLEKGLSPEQVKPLREYFFGAVDENRVAVGSAEYIVLNPPQAGGPLRYFMYPYAEEDGKALGEDLFGFNIGYKIAFKEL